MRASMPEKFVNFRWMVIATPASEVGGLQIVFLGGRGRCLVRNPWCPVTPPSETKVEEVNPRLKNNITMLTAAVVVISSSRMGCSWHMRRWKRSSSVSWVSRVVRIRICWSECVIRD